VTRASWWPWFAAAVVLGLAAFALVLSVLAGDHADPWWEFALGLAAVLVSLALGLMIALRRPGNRMALPLFAKGLVRVLPSGGSSPLGRIENPAAAGFFIFCMCQLPHKLVGVITNDPRSRD
jgi:hypothetical protein